MCRMPRLDSPRRFARKILLSDDELADELLCLTDWHTDELFGGLWDHGVARFVNRLSRLVFDPERFLDDAAEPSAAQGQGVVYWRGARGRQLRAPDAALRQRRIEELYRPYHAALTAVVAGMLEHFGQCTIVNCHSFPSMPLPSEIESGAPAGRSICIGTDAVHTPPDVADAVEAAFCAEGFRVRRNTPFAGTFVPSGFHGRDSRVHSVIVEVRRDLYIDETTAECRPEFDAVRAAIERAMMAGLGIT